MRALHLAIGAVALATALAIPTPAHAVPPPQVELGVFGGYHYFAESNQLGRDVGSTPENRLKQSGTFGLRLGFIVNPYVDLEAELGLTPTSASTVLGYANALAINYRAHLLVHFLKGRIRPFLLAGGGGNTLSSSNADVLKEDTDGEFHAGVGLKYDVRKNWGIRIDARIYIVPTVDVDRIYATNDFEATFGFYGLFGGPKPVPPPPPKPVDTDGDGVADKDDLCPTERGLVENKGCPDKDSDHDFIVDRLDKCPQQAGPEENGGCPDTDSDKDGVVDRLDKCPQLAGLPENGGCPDTDSDKDGIVDRLDKCPNEPETLNGYKDLDGCPDTVPPEAQRFVGTVKGVAFVPGKATLQASSNKVLDEVVAMMKTDPAVKFEVQGHADEMTDATAAFELARARAEAVRKYLVDKGVEGNRLTAVPQAAEPGASKKAPKTGRVDLKLVS